MKNLKNAAVILAGALALSDKKIGFDKSFFQDLTENSEIVFTIQKTAGSKSRIWLYSPEGTVFTPNLTNAVNNEYNGALTGEHAPIDDGDMTLKVAAADIEVLAVNGVFVSGTGVTLTKVTKRIYSVVESTAKTSDASAADPGSEPAE